MKHRVLSGPFYSGYYPVAVCVKCSFTIDHDMKFRNGGVCPFCGHDSKSTICETINRIQREVYNKEWYLFGLISVKRHVKYEVR